MRGQRRKGSFYQSRDANRAPDQALARSRPRGGRQFVPTARRAPGEDWSLRSTVCRHQESRESSDEHEVAPCRVRARGLPHASRPRSEPEDGLRRSAARPLLATLDLPRWSLVALGPGVTRSKLKSSIVTHLADAPSIGPRTASPPPCREQERNRVHQTTEKDGTVDWLDTERFSSVRRDAETDTDFTVPLDTHRISHCFSVQTTTADYRTSERHALRQAFRILPSGS